MKRAAGICILVALFVLFGLALGDIWGLVKIIGLSLGIAVALLVAIIWIIED